MTDIEDFDGPRFVQLHLLTSYPPSNLNRDDLGRPKTAVMGDVNRLRVSSQSLKRAWRTSDLFKDALSGHIGKRTRALGRKVYRDLRQRDISREDAIDWSREIAGHFASLDASDSDADDVKESEEDPTEAGILDTGQLFHLSPEEFSRVEDLTQRIAERGEGPEDDELDVLRERTNAIDISMFGRMLADNAEYNVEAAVQVSHALTVHGVTVEDDFFTAVDDLNTDEDTGSGHMGELEFGSGVYYLYLCINRHQLAANLGPEHQDLVDPSMQALTEAAAKVAPEGKQATFGSRAYASYLLAEKGDQQPRSLSVAFLQPVEGRDVMAQAIDALEEQVQTFDRTYGDTADARARMDAHRGKGGLEQTLEFLDG
jgi:CRISPR system Cascade subunit CasC